MTSGSAERGRRQFLFLHHNSPGQFVHLTTELLRQGHEVHFACQNVSPRLPEGVHSIRLPAKRKQKTRKERLAFEAELYNKLLRKKQRGLDPDWVIWHTGWGLGLCLRDLFPQASFLGYAEWWFSLGSADFRFDPENPDVRFTPWMELAMVERNRTFAHELSQADVIVAPTQWQRSQLPPPLRRRCRVIHEGCDTTFFDPRQRQPRDSLPPPLSQLPPEPAPLVTYATRGMDPYRGFPEACRAMAAVLRKVPELHLAIAGDDRVVYAPGQADRQYGKEARQLFREAGVVERVHFLGHLPLDQYRQVLLHSSLHLYFTRPFVLSWSLLEAMSCGCPILASRVEPVEELIQHSIHGLLVDHTQPGLSDRILEALADRAWPIRRKAARQRIKRRYGTSRSLAAYGQLLSFHPTATQTTS